MNRGFQIGGLVLVALVLSASSAKGGLLGTTVTASYFHPDLSTSIGSQDFLVGAGIEMSCGSGGFCAVFDAPPETLDFTDNQIIFTQGPYNSTSNYDNAPYNGFVFTNLNMGNPITGFLLASNGFTGLSNSNITFTANSLNLNLSTIPFATSAGFTLTLLTSPVPEPGTSTLAAAALGLGALLYRRHRLHPRP